MFTGIILAVGKIAAIERRSGDCRLTIDTGKLPMHGANLGDSIAVNGVCLTAIDLRPRSFTADVSNETLSRTSLKFAAIGTPVNLEPALTPSTRMGGHIVSGHVDGLATVISRTNDARSVRINFQVPTALSKYIAEKGSVCLDGVSLTVNEVNEDTFGVNIVPHTLQETTIGLAQTGSIVNLEVDLLARYLERLLCNREGSRVDAGATLELLAKSGFIG